MPRRPLSLTLVALVALAATLALGPAPTPAGAQAPRRYVDPVFGAVTVTADLVYGAAPDEHGATQQLRLDLYEPTGDTETARPTVVLAHGGGFVHGGKGDMASVARGFAQRGYVAVSIEYRMDEAAGSITFPPSAAQRERIAEAVHDMQAAVRWVRSQAAARRLHPDKVAVSGYSAGAVMAVVAATRPDDVGASGNPGFSSAVCTAVARAGAGDPVDVGPGDAGALFLHGDDDLTVPRSQAVATSQAMAAAGLPTRVVTYPGAGHAPPYSWDVVTGWLVELMVNRAATCAGPDAASRSFVRAAYADLLGRAPSAGEVADAAGPLDAGQRRSVLLTRLTRSDEWVGSVVRGFYLDTLGREPDAAGRAYWVEAIVSGRRTVAQVAASFHAAPEAYALRGGGRDDTWVDHLYGALLGRPADAAGRAYWVGQVAARGRTWVATAFFGSAESRGSRVTALYQHLLGRAPEPDGRAYWADRVGREGDLALARSLAASAEYGARAVARFP